MVSIRTLKAKRYKTDGRPFLEVVTGENGHLILRVRQATDTGYIECDPNGVADLSYPSSELRRARVKERGAITSTITAGEPAQYVFLEMADQNAIELPSELKGKKFRIRKLTPRECFRLMGVDDKDIDKMQAAGISQSGQYKLAGNSIVVDVLFHIFRKMFIETDQDFDGTPTQLTLF
jgi:DNA (cytosine-5)-methyltransferase 1